MSELTIALMESERDAVLLGHSHCLGCGAEIPVEYAFGERPTVRWSCGTLRCNTRMWAKHVRGLRVIEGGRDE